MKALLLFENHYVCTSEAFDVYPIAIQFHHKLFTEARCRCRSVDIQHTKTSYATNQLGRHRTLYSAHMNILFKNSSLHFDKQTNSILK